MIIENKSETLFAIDGLTSSQLSALSYDGRKKILARMEIVSYLLYDVIIPRES